jgi:DNA repair exonuclease SbcCD ATPase subunit
MDLNGALVGPDKEEDKGRTVFSVLDANGTLLVKLKALKKTDDEMKEWTARIESVAHPSETFNAAAAFSKEEEEALAAEAAAAKEMEDIVVAQDVLKQAEDKVEELKVELADVENLKQEAADDPALLVEIVADIDRLSRELSEAEAAVAHAKSDLQREIEEAATAEKIAHKERAEAEEAQENYSKVRTAAEEQHAAARQHMLAQREEQRAGVVGSTVFDELPQVPEERRSYLQWLFQHKYDEENRGSIETSLVEQVLCVPRTSASWLECTN